MFIVQNVAEEVNKVANQFPITTHFCSLGQPIPMQQNINL